MSSDPSNAPPARRAALADLLASRLVVLATGMFAALAIGRAAGTEGFDPAHLTAPFGALGNLLAAPAARWDSVWYLSIADSGYAPDPLRTAFFPLYPGLIALLRPVTGGSALAAGALISLLAFAAALVVLERLAVLDLDPPAARLTVTLVAFSPVAYCFSSVYTESLFLLLSAGALLAARRDRWALAGALGALAAATRNSGILLLLPLAVLRLWGPVTAAALVGRRSLRPTRPVRPDVLWLALVPAGLGAYLAYLAIAGLDPMAPFRVERAWLHHFAGPLGGAWDGTVAAWDGLRQLVHGPPPPLYWTHSGGDALTVAGQDLMLFAFLLAGLLALLSALRRLPIAYALYAAATLGLALSYPVEPQPLQSLPRYEVVLFPLFMAGADWARRRGLAQPVLASSAVLLGLFTAEFATWRFVA